jgi:nuclear pore complex protein Nup62
VKITEVYTDVKKVGIQQKDLDSNLDMILSQQNELEKMLDGMEDKVDSLYQSTTLNGPDKDRQMMYQTADDINKQLDSMTGSLKDMITKLNVSFEKSIDPENKVNQIVQILNSHLTTLQWVDQKCSTLQNEISSTSEAMKYQK